ncbi:hypothetical protein DI243_13990 [Paenibacillus polymyxa]|nr:hypothetical protein DI243_13990 [Paenibacillus polymyxa]
MHEVEISQDYLFREHEPTNEASTLREEIAPYNINKKTELEAKDSLLELTMSKFSSMCNVRWF